MSVTEDFELPNQFPISMRVLAVDRDEESRFFLRNLLSFCQFQDVEVTVVDKSKMALELVKDKKVKFDLIIIEKEMPDMDGFELLQLIILETDTPVICNVISCSSINPELMEKAIKYGAYFVLSKPLTVEMLNNTCIYVLTKHKVESEKGEIAENVNELEAKDVSIISNSKRKIEDSTNQKKARFHWTTELNKKFVDVVETLEAMGERVAPKKILELMNVENLTRGNVSSYLQKYRESKKKEEAARNNDSSLAIQTKTIQTKTRQMPTTHFSKMSYNNNSTPQPNPLHHQSGQVISNITPIPASGTFLQTPNEMKKNQQVRVDHGFDQMFFNNNNSRLHMAAPNNGFLARNKQQVPSYASDNGNMFQQLRSSRDNFDHFDYNNKNSLLMPAPRNIFLGGNQEQSRFSNQISGFNVPNNHFEVPLETNLDVNHRGLYRDMEFGEMNKRRDDLVSSNERYLMDEENELPSGSLDIGDGFLTDLVNSYTNK